MKWIHISDTHNRHKKLILEPCDVLIHSGDFTGQGRDSELKEFLKWWNLQDAFYKILVPGNHDLIFDTRRWTSTNQESFYEILNKYIYHDFNSHLLIDGYVEIEGIKIFGSPWSSTTRTDSKWAFHTSPEHEEEIYSRIPKDIDILINHGPVYNQQDWALPNKNRDVAEHCGSHVLAAYVEEIQPKYVLSGHIHEDYGVTEENNTIFSNAAVCDREYNVINAPFIFNL